MHLVREFRLKYGWDQMELARRAEVSMKLITNIELNSNHDCQRKTMIKISDAFNLPPSVVFFPVEEVEKRKMLSALVAVCIQHVPEHQVYTVLQELNRKPAPPSEPDSVYQEDLEQSPERQPSAVALS